MTINHFEHRMTILPRHQETKEIGDIQEDTLKLKIEQAEANKSLPFTMTELEEALKSLKSGKLKISMVTFVSYLKRVFWNQFK